MKAFLLGLVAGLLFLAFSGGVLWFLSYSTEDQFSGQINSARAESEISVFNADENPGIEASSRKDVICGIAYAQVLKDPWSVALYRQTAIGRLGEWFGKDVRTIDKHMREIGIPYYSDQEYRQLDPSIRQEIDHFTACLNEAMSSSKVTGRDEFVLLKIAPEEWQPWNTLAVYRMLAWVNAEVEVDTLVNIETASLINFIENKKNVAEWLSLGGQKHHLAWTSQRDDTLSLGARLVYGSAADSPLMPLSIYSESVVRHALCYKGTLSCPFISRDDESAIHIPSRGLQIRTRDLKAGNDGSWPESEIDKIVFRDGEEELVERRVLDRALFLDEQPDTTGFGMDTVFVYTNSKWTPSDTVLVLDDTVRTNIVLWDGFSPLSDQEKWLSRILPDSEGDYNIETSLLSDLGISIRKDGAATNWGEPRLLRQLDRGILVANDQSSDIITERINEIALVDSLIFGNWYKDSKSIWSQNLQKDLIPILQKAELSEDEILSLAGRYVKNWDGYFSDENIGASIFTTWMSIYRKQNGDWPYFPPPSDTLTLAPSDERLLSSLKEAFDHLRNTVDVSPDKWMWNVVQPGSLYKAVWSSDLLEQKPAGSGTTKIYPIQNVHGGHFSTVRWQSSDGEDPANAAWYVSIANYEGAQLRLFDDANRPRNLFGRLSATSSPQEFFLSDGAPVSDKTVLIRPGAN